MNNRKQKIEFLKGLMTGKRKLSELQPVKHYCFIQEDDNPNLYKDTNDNRILTEEQLNELERENPNSNFFIIVSISRHSHPRADRIDFDLAS